MCLLMQLDQSNKTYFKTRETRHQITFEIHNRYMLSMIE